MTMKIWIRKNENEKFDDNSSVPNDMPNESNIKNIGDDYEQ